MDILKLIANYRPFVEKRIVNIFDSLENEILPTQLDYAFFLKKTLLDFSLSGKFFRSALYLIVCQMYGCRDVDKFIDIAAALELSHSGLLIHDDVMDNGKIRRGKPAIHTQYDFLADKLKIFDRENYGKNKAICLGDICFFMANILIENTPVTNVIKKRIIKYFNIQIIKTGLAQISDVVYSMSLKDPGIDEILKIYRYKTGNYTFNNPLILGYLSSGKTDPKEIILLESIGYSLGVIYQIVDDLIGLVQDKEVIGKDMGVDVRENKKTIVRFYLLKYLKGKDRDFARYCFGNKDLSFSEFKELRRIFYLRGIDRKINTHIQTELKKAIQNISKLKLGAENKQQIISFANYLVSRVK